MKTALSLLLAVLPLLLSVAEVDGIQSFQDKGTGSGCDGYNYLEQGLSNRKDRNFEQAKLYFDSAANCFRSNQEAERYIESISYKLEALRMMKESSKGIKIGEQVLLENESLLASDGKLAGLFYYALGALYAESQSEASQGFSYLQQAEDLEKNSQNPNRQLLNLITSAKATSHYYLLEYEAAIKEFEKAIRNFDSSSDFVSLSEYYRGLGNSYWGINQLETASEYFDKSLEILYQSEQPDSLTIGRVLHSQGYIHMDLEDYGRAIQTYKKGYSFIQNVLPKVHPLKVWQIGDVARAFLYSEMYDSALYYLQRSLVANAYEFDNLDPYVNPGLENISDEFQQFMVLKLKAETLANKYIETQKDNDYAATIATYELADQQIEKIRKSINKAEDQSNLNFYTTEIYHEAFKNFTRIHKVDGNIESLSKAHYYLEKLHVSRVLLKFLESSAQAEMKLPSEILESENDIIENVTHLKSEILRMHREENDSLSIQQEALFQAERSYDNHLANLKKNYPEYHEAKYNVEPKSLNDVQEILKSHERNTAIISCFKYGSSLDIELITADTIHLFTNEIVGDLEDMVTNFRKSLLDPSNQDSLNAGSEIYKLVLADPLKKLENQSISNLIIIPPIELQLIPFEVLKPSSESPFLLEQYTINYHYSVSLFANQLTKTSTKSKVDFLGFAPNFGLKSDLDKDELDRVRSGAGLEALPGAEDEVVSLSEVTSGKSFLRDDATETIFKKSIEDAGLIHLATHAIVNEKDPESSYLQLGLDDEYEDGRLHFFEIYNMKLDAQLVTLSACNTGFGSIQRGEGVMSLSRAFAYAGVPSTVVSLWPASDKSTPELMKYFYENLKEGQPKDVALNNARKQYLAQAKGKARHPFYWGGFILIGDNQPLERNSNNLIWMMLGFILVIVISTIIRKRKT